MTPSSQTPPTRHLQPYMLYQVDLKRSIRTLKNDREHFSRCMYKTGPPTLTMTKKEKSNAKVTAHKGKTGATKKKVFYNTMSHLLLKRFADNDPTLTAGAKRDRTKYPYVAIAQMDPSGRATCKLCGEKIAKAALRFGLMLECHKGYRNLCTLHPDCFWIHPETTKLVDAKEIHRAPNLSKDDGIMIDERFEKLVTHQNMQVISAEGKDKATAWADENAEENED
jgi:hypothetical protein